jgi:hypothetical protein
MSRNILQNMASNNETSCIYLYVVCKWSYEQGNEKENLKECKAQEEYYILGFYNKMVIRP